MNFAGYDHRICVKVPTIGTKQARLPNSSSWTIHFAAIERPVNSCYRLRNAFG